MQLKNIIASCMILTVLGGRVVAQEKEDTTKTFAKKTNSKNITLLEERLEKQSHKKPAAIDSAMYIWSHRERSFKSLYLRHGLNNLGPFYTIGLLKNNYVFEIEGGKELRSVSRAIFGPFIKQLRPELKEDADSNASTYFATIRGMGRQQFHLLGAVFEYGIGLNFKAYIHNNYAQVMDSTYNTYNPLTGQKITYFGEPRLVDRPYTEGIYYTMGPSIYLRALPGKYDGDGIVSVLLGVDGIFPLYKREPSLEVSVSVMLAPFKWAK